MSEVFVGKTTDLMEMGRILPESLKQARYALLAGVGMLTHTRYKFPP